MSFMKREYMLLIDINLYLLNLQDLNLYCGGESIENLSSVHTTYNVYLILEVEFSCTNSEKGKILAAGALSNILLIMQL